MKARILLADDDPAVRASLSGALLTEDYQVIPASDGQQAVDIAASTDVDLVLLDVNMPVKNGWDAFERLTSQNPFLPIIVITAQPNQLFTAIGAGVGALLEKPIEIPTLLSTIRDLLAESSKQRLARMVGRDPSLHYHPAPAPGPPPSVPRRGASR